MLKVPLEVPVPAAVPSLPDPPARPTPTVHRHLLHANEHLSFAALDLKAALKIMLDEKGISFRWIATLCQSLAGTYVANDHAKGLLREIEKREP